MGDVRVFEAADDFGDGIGFTDVAEEFIAQAFAFGRTGDEAGDVDEAHDSRDCFFRFIHVGQDLEAFVRDFYDADIRFDRAEGVVCRFCAGLGNRVEQCALTDIRQADDAYFQIGTQWLNHLYLNNCEPLPPIETGASWFVENSGIFRRTYPSYTLSTGVTSRSSYGRCDLSANLTSHMLHPEWVREREDNHKSLIGTYWELTVLVIDVSDSVRP